MSDILKDLQRDYFLGNFQPCINKAISAPEQENVTAKFYLCLSYLHLKKYDLLDAALDNTTNLVLSLVRDLANYIRFPEKRDSIIERTIQNAGERGLIIADIRVSLVLSSIFVRHKLYGRALEVLEQPEKWDTYDTLPAQYAKIETYLLMNRPDLAENQLKSMQEQDDFAAVTQLAYALVKLATNKPGDALDALVELEEKYRATPLLKNLQASAAVCMGNYDLAKQHCENSLDLDHDNLETLINIIHILTKLKGTSDIRDRHFERLKSLYPEHEFVREFERMTSDLKAC